MKKLSFPSPLLAVSCTLTALSGVAHAAPDAAPVAEAPAGAAAAPPTSASSESPSSETAPAEPTPLAAEDPTDTAPNTPSGTEASQPQPAPTPTEGADSEREEPPKKLRPLSTDRPDVTESPYTVDRLHFQAEFDMARYTTDAGVDSYSFMSSNLKIGITNFWEVQLVIDGLVGLPTATGHEWGAGDMDIRTKFNLLGNDSGPIAIGVMPWLTFPKVGSTDQIEGGLIGLFGWSLPADFSTGIMVEGDFVKNELDSDYHFELLNTWTVGHPIVGPLSAYVEAFGVYSNEPGAEYALSMDGGFTFAVTEYVQLDAGVVGGLTEAADDLSVFSGLSFKL